MYPGREVIYQATIARMVRESLMQQETQFAETHKNDTDEELLAYLRKCASELGHSPYRKELVGGTYIEDRFGSWEKALIKAGISRHHTTPGKVSTFQLVIDETNRQKVIYRKRKKEKKQQSLQREITRQRLRAERQQRRSNSPKQPEGCVMDQERIG